MVGKVGKVGKGMGRKGKEREGKVGEEGGDEGRRQVKGREMERSKGQMEEFNWGYVGV